MLMPLVGLGLVTIGVGMIYRWWHKPAAPEFMSDEWMGTTRWDHLTDERRSRF